MKVRLKFLVLPEFQIKLFLAAFIPFCATLGFLFFQLSNSMNRMNLYIQSVGLSHNSDINKMLSIQQNILSNSIWISAVLGAVIMSITLLIISHRLAGPLRRMQTHLREMRISGKATPLHFRKGDYLQKFESDLNHCLMNNFETSEERQEEVKKSA